MSAEAWRFAIAAMNAVQLALLLALAHEHNKKRRARRRARKTIELRRKLARYGDPRLHSSDE